MTFGARLGPMYLIYLELCPGTTIRRFCWVTAGQNNGDGDDKAYKEPYEVMWFKISYKLVRQLEPLVLVSTLSRRQS